MSQRGSQIPNFSIRAPLLTVKKDRPYWDFILINNDTVSNEVFYLSHDCTIVTDDLANTTLYKWSGNGWVAVSGLVSPDVIVGRGFFSVTTAADATVLLSEHTD